MVTLQSSSRPQTLTLWKVWERESGKLSLAQYYTRQLKESRLREMEQLLGIIKYNYKTLGGIDIIMYIYIYNIATFCEGGLRGYNLRPVGSQCS